MGNSESSSRESSKFYRYHDPYAYGNPLPIPPKEPLPQGPYPHHLTPYMGPETIHERASNGDGSNGRKRGNSILKSLGGLGRKLNGSAATKNDPNNPWTFPDGTPFPIMKPELSPHIRPARFRSSSFSGRDKNTDRRYLWGDHMGNDEEPHPASLWRKLAQGKPTQRLGGEPKRAMSQRSNRPRYIWEDTHTKDGYFHDDGRPLPGRPRRSLSETRVNRTRGVSIDGYVPPERRNREWEYPDGTPYPKLNEIRANLNQNGVPVFPGVGRPGATPAASAGPLPRPPSPHHFPTAGANGAGEIIQPLASSSNGVPIEPYPIHGAHAHVRHVRHPLELEHERLAAVDILDDPMNPLFQTVPGTANYLNPDVTFSCDRNSGLCHFSYHGVVSGNKLYPTAYHLWEAMKWFDTKPEYARRMRRCERVRDAIKLAEELGLEGAREDWERICLSKLDEVLYIKARQHSSILLDLYSTEHRHIVFLSQREPFWGFSTLSLTGDNQLGRSLERVRDRLYSEEGNMPSVPNWKLQEVEAFRARQRQKEIERARELQEHMQERQARAMGL